MSLLFRGRPQCKVCAHNPKSVQRFQIRPTILNPSNYFESIQRFQIFQTISNPSDNFKSVRQFQIHSQLLSQFETIKTLHSEIVSDIVE